MVFVRKWIRTEQSNTTLYAIHKKHHYSIKNLELLDELPSWDTSSNFIIDNNLFHWCWTQLGELWTRKLSLLQAESTHKWTSHIEVVLHKTNSTTQVRRWSFCENHNVWRRNRKKKTKLLLAEYFHMMLMIWDAKDLWARAANDGELSGGPNRTIIRAEGSQILWKVDNRSRAVLVILTGSDPIRNRLYLTLNIVYPELQWTIIVVYWLLGFIIKMSCVIQGLLCARCCLKQLPNEHYVPWATNK